MYIKTFNPIQILTNISNVMLVEILNEKYNDFTSARVEIEFYDVNKTPIDKCTFVMKDLPVNSNINYDIDIGGDYNLQFLKDMFNTQAKIVFDEIKQRYGLTYYDDTWGEDEKLTFSNMKFEPGYWYNYKDKLNV